MPIELRGNDTNWVLVDFPEQEVLNSITFPGTDTGYIAGNWGIVAKTTNAGLNWIIQTTGVSQIIRSIHFPNNNTGYFVGNFGTSYKTTNGGENWISMNIPGNLSSVYFLNNNTGFIGGENTKLKTTNGGVNWTSINIPVSSYSKIYFYDNVKGYILSGKSIYMTIDSGNTWDSIFTYNGVQGASFSSIFFPSANIGYASMVYSNMFNNGSIILKTTNGGNDWQQMYQGYTHYISKMYFKNNNAGITVSEGSLGYVFYTTNGGFNWHQSFWTDYGLKDVVFTTPETGFIIGGEGSILRTTNFGGIVTSINYSNTINISSFSLSQNYPNPFNPSTKIKFDIPKGSLVKLKIYDILGREVATLVNEKLNPGTYEYEWNGIDLSSGIYFYKLEAENFIQTKRMVLVK